jgi:hypothetical protein
MPRLWRNHQSKIKNHKSETQSTAFPQRILTMCKDCELHFFFRRNPIADRDINQVQKKS